MATVQQVVEVFLASVKADRKPNTHKQYSTRLRPFALKFSDREFGSIEPLEIEQYLIEAGKFPDGRQKAPDTRRINAIAILQLQQFALDKKVIAAKIVTKLKKPTGRKRERLPTEAETIQILQHASPEYRLIYQALRQSGTRPSELAGATLAHWDRTANVIELTEHKTADKTGKPRRIPVGEQLQKMLLTAVGDRTEGAIFLSPRRQPWTSAGLTQTFTRLRKRAGLPNDLVQYLARHEHGTLICREKGIHATAEALGHTNIKTAARYVHADDQQRRANQDLFHAGSLDPPEALPLTKGEVGGGSISPSSPDISREMKAGPGPAPTDPSP